MQSLKQLGYSFIELLLVLIITLFLTSSILHLYLIQKKAYDYLQGLARLQENMRTAAHFLQTDIRMAGFIGCKRLNNFINCNGQVGLSPNNSLTSDLATDITIPHNKLPDTEGIIIRKLSNILANAKPLSGQVIEIMPNYGIKLGDILLLSDCRHAEIIQIQEQVATNSFRITHKLQYSYLSPQIGHLHVIYYYLGWTNRYNSEGKKIPALYRIDLLAHDAKATEVVEGIEGMQIAYNKVSDYKSTNNDSGGNWQSFKALHISLIATSIEPCLEKANPDRMLRKRFHLYIALRERIAP